MNIKTTIDKYNNKSKFNKKVEITNSNIIKPTKILFLSKTKFSINPVVVFNKSVNISIF